MINYKEKLQPVRAFVFDFDGVMTDGSVWTLFNGDTIRAGNTKDGYAVQYAVKKGYTVAVISGATSASIDLRIRALGAQQCLMGCADKAKGFSDFLRTHQLRPDEVLCMGDDIPDLPMLRLAGVSACPADAAVEVKQAVDYISHCGGGHGCVRDVIEQVLRLHGQWFHEDAVLW